VEKNFFKSPFVNEIKVFKRFLANFLILIPERAARGKLDKAGVTAYSCASEEMLIFPAKRLSSNTFGEIRGKSQG
jgi:hypothetical protein